MMAIQLKSGSVSSTLHRAMATLHLAIALVVMGCDSSAPPSVPDGHRSITVQLNWVPEPEFGGIYAALQDGLYAKAGMAVEIIKGGGQVPCAQLAASGKVEFAIVSAEEVLTLRARGGPIVAVFATFQQNPMGFLLHAENPLDTVEQLWRSDTTLGVDPGLPFITLLNQRYSGAKLKLVPYSGGLATFMGNPQYGQQCFITSEPVECQLRGIPAKIISMSDIFNPYAAVMATSESFLEANPTVVDAFVHATAQGWANYFENPQKYNPAIAAANPSMSVEAMNIAAGLERPLIVPPQGVHAIGQMTAERWQTLCQQLIDGKVIDSCDAVEKAYRNPPPPILQPSNPR